MKPDEYRDVDTRIREMVPPALAGRISNCTFQEKGSGCWRTAAGLPSGSAEWVLPGGRTIYKVVSRRRRSWWTGPEWQPDPFVRFAVYKVAVDYLIFNCSRGAFRYLLGLSCVQEIQLRHAGRQKATGKQRIDALSNGLTLSKLAAAVRLTGDKLDRDDNTRTR